MDNERDEYLKKLDKYADNLRENKFYSMQRIDLLIISVSGAGIYICFELLRYLASNEIFKPYLGCVNIPLKISGVLFTLAIVSNFISQWCAYKGSSYQLIATNKDIYARENNTDDTVRITQLEYIAGLYNKATSLSNLISNVLMIIGLLFLIGFVLHLF